MKNICFFNSAITWGGGEKWHLEVSTFMHQMDYNVLVVAHEKSELLKKLKRQNIPCTGINVSNLSFLNPFKIRKVKKILERHKTDTILINLSRDLKLAGLAAKKVPLKKIIYCRGSATPIKNSFLNRYYFKNIVTDVLANSEATKKTVLEKNKSLFPKEKIKVIYNAMDTLLFSSNGISQERDPHDNGEKTILMTLGRLEYEKNQKFLIYLAEELKQRGLEFEIWIGGEGSQYESLAKLSRDRNVNDLVRFFGFIDKPQDFLNNGDIFLLTSLWEGFGYVLAEAGLCKKPVVAFNVTSTPEVVIHNKTGYLTPLNEIIPFANAVETLIKDKGLRRTMGDAGREFIENTFDKNIILKDIEHYLVHGE